MERIVLTTFTDPMMGLSYEHEPVLRQLETHFGAQIEFRTVMALLVRDAHDFMTAQERSRAPEERFRLYNARLARIYQSEEAIGGLPILMDGFALFAPDRPSSLPLNLAFKAAQLIAPDKAERFLYRLRYAVVVETRPATKRDELIRVAALTGLDTALFSHALSSAKTREALERDLRFTASLGVHSLPATLVQYGNSAMMLSGMGDFHEHAQVIMRVSDGAVVHKHDAVSRDDSLLLARTSADGFDHHKRVLHHLELHTDALETSVEILVGLLHVLGLDVCGVGVKLLQHSFDGSVNDFLVFEVVNIVVFDEEFRLLEFPHLGFVDGDILCRGGCKSYNGQSQCCDSFHIANLFF